MNTEESTGTDDFPISPEQMKWPFRTEEERKKIIKWHKKQQKRSTVLEGAEKLRDIDLAPF
jgi:hypothetical protein